MPWNSQSAHQNWQSIGSQGWYGTDAYGAGGSPSPMARDELDHLRIGQGRVPSAEYPDGYLGTIRTRREDRMLNAARSRVTQRSYQRGVHKGERIDPGDYVWPPGFGMEVGLEAEAKGKRQAPQFDMAPPPHLVNDGKANLIAGEPVVIDPKRRQQLARMLPAWR